MLDVVAVEMVPIVKRGDSDAFFEKAEKTDGIFKSAAVRDFLYLQIGGIQQLQGVMQTAFHDELPGRFSRRFPEERPEGMVGHAELLRNDVLKIVVTDRVGTDGIGQFQHSVVASVPASVASDFAFVATAVHFAVPLPEPQRPAHPPPVDLTLP